MNAIGGRTARPFGIGALNRRGGAACRGVGNPDEGRFYQGNRRRRYGEDPVSSTSSHLSDHRVRSETVAAGRQKLLVVWGQIQSYAFQVELLKRCDPEVAKRFVVPLKTNALTVRYLKLELKDGVSSQRNNRLTALTCSVWLALCRACVEGERLIAALEDYAEDGDARAYFEKSMELTDPCKFHADLAILTYGGAVNTHVRFLHDAENVLKQLNYCHLIVSADSAEPFLREIERFLLDTVGAGGVVPQELYDPSHPCSVCFEELCVTANRGESAHKRVVGKMCDHVTKQVKLRVLRDDISCYLPHATHVDREKRLGAQAELARIAASRSGPDREASDGSETIRDMADAALDAHNVFVPATSKLYAVSELKFWLASSGDKCASSRGTTVDAFSDNLDALDTRETDFETQTAVVETVVFGRKMNHFEREFEKELMSMKTIDRLLLGGRSSSPDDIIEALIKACYDHHLSAPLLRRLADPEKAAEEALRKALLDSASAATKLSYAKKSCKSATAAKIMGLAADPRDYGEFDDSDEETAEEMRESLKPQYRFPCPPPRMHDSAGHLRPIPHLGPPGGATYDDEDGAIAGFDLYRSYASAPGHEAKSEEDYSPAPWTDDDGWAELSTAASADAVKRRKMYADRLTKRSLAALDRCVTEQRQELEKALRVNIFGEVLIDAYVAVHNGYVARRKVLEMANGEAAELGACIVDNRRCDKAFDAHRFMMATLLRRRVDPAMLPSLTHKFFQLVNGPLFDHDIHTFAQPPNTALYFSVENVGLLPHMKEELARFMMSPNRTDTQAGVGDKKKRTAGGLDWTVSGFRGFYDFEGVEGVTAAQRLAWKYIKELILAAAVFSSVFRCGEVRVLRADSVPTDSAGEKVWRDGIYITYEKECPLVAVLGTTSLGRMSPDTTVILDSDVFSLLYSVLQKMAPGAVEKARSEDGGPDVGCSATGVTTSTTGQGRY